MIRYFNKVLCAILMIILAAGLAGAAGKQASPATPARIDPAFIEVPDDPRLPRVLLIGDSVSIGYTPALRKLLAGKANMHRPLANCGSTSVGLQNLEKWLGSGKWDVIHFNFGLHDLSYIFPGGSNQDARGNYATLGTGRHKVPPAQYERNLREIVTRLKKTGARLIWCTTTPVPVTFHAYVKGDEREYNTVAARVMQENGITIDDLCAFAQPQLERIQIPANVHFTAKGSEALAGQVAHSIEAAIGMDQAAMEGPFEPAWQSLEQYQVPDWFRDAKFGIFVHWGPQTLAGGRDGSSDGLKTRNWTDYATAFRGEKFDANHLAELFKRAGAKYVVQVAEHHDGYALYDSSLTTWTSVKRTPGRDFVAELAAAVRKRGLVFGASSHTEEYWWFYGNPPKPAPPAPLPGRPVAPQPDKAFLDWWYARQVEIIDKYHPQVLWFDWCIEQPGYEPYLRRLAAYYYNRAAQWRQGVVFNYKYNAIPARAAVLDISWNTSRFSWKPEQIHPTPWQFDTMSNRSYWFWRQGMEMRPLAEILAEMADVVSKNGNYLLNIPPTPDGTLTSGQEEILRGIGKWMTVNEEAIYGTRPWKIYGEGPTEGLGPKFQGNPPKTPYTAQDIRFTAKGGVLYAIVLAGPADGKIMIKALAEGSTLLDRGIRSIRLLGSGEAIAWKRGPAGLSIRLPVPAGSTLPIVLKIQ